MSANRAVRLRRASDRASTVAPETGPCWLGRGRAGRVAPLVVVLMGASVFLIAPGASAAQGPVGLGTADSFAILAGSGITNTGPTTITGDIGTFPTPSETGFGSITLSGTNHDGDAVTQGAKKDLVTAYNDAFGRKPVTSVPVELGGSTLLAGVYTSPTFGLTGTLTLNAQGNTDAEFIFQAGSTLITASNSRVLLLNGADPCRVVWQVGSSATFNTGTRFIGDVLAQTSITAETGATFQGRLLARDGAVTLDTNTITSASCAAPVASGGATPTTVATTSTTQRTSPTTTAPKAQSVLSAIPGGGSPGASAPTVNRLPAPGPVAPAGPASVTGTPSLAGPPPGTPGGPPNQTSGTPPSATPSGTPPLGTTPGPPFLAFTGLGVTGLVSMASGLLVLGALGLAAGRRARRSHVA
jgi:hypothetical protein